MSSIRGLIMRFWQLVDEDSVRPFIWLYYIPWLLWSMLTVAGLMPSVGALEDAMGGAVYQAWLLLTIPGTLFPMIGLALRHGGSSVAQISTPLLFADRLGLAMQTGGHACMCFLLTLFEYSAWSAALVLLPNQPGVAGLIMFCATILMAYVLGTVLLTLQCLRKFHKGSKLRRRLS